MMDDGLYKKHQFRLDKHKHPLWHVFACSVCGELLRISKWDIRRLTTGERIYAHDFLPTCAAIEAVKKEEEPLTDSGITQPVDPLINWLTNWFAQAPQAHSRERKN